MTELAFAGLLCHNFREASENKKKHRPKPWPGAVITWARFGSVAPGQAASGPTIKREDVMRKLITLAAAAAVTVLALAVANSPADAAGGPRSKIGLGKLQAPASGIWLRDHYDNRSTAFSPFNQVTGGPAFDDSAEVELDGNIGGIGRATVEQSAAWTWTTFGAVSSCAQVYDSSRTLVRIHTHQGVSTENASGPLTLIPGSAVNDPGGTSEFPFSGAGVGANGLNVGVHAFNAIVTITDENGDTITGDVLGGTNCEVAVFSSVGGHPPAGVFNFTHNDTENTVTTVFDITAGTGAFAGASGDGVVVFTYDTFEPHGLLSASISINLELP